MEAIPRALDLAGPASPRARRGRSPLGASASLNRFPRYQSTKKLARFTEKGAPKKISAVLDKVEGMVLPEANSGVEAVLSSNMGSKQQDRPAPGGGPPREREQ